MIDIIFFIISIVTIEIFIKSNFVTLIKNFFLMQNEFIRSVFYNRDKSIFFLNYKKLILLLLKIIFKLFLILIPVIIFIVTIEIFYKSEKLFFFSLKGNILLFIVSVVYYYKRVKK